MPASVSIKITGNFVTDFLGSSSGLFVCTCTASAPAYQGWKTNWSWRWRFIAQKASRDWCGFFDVRFSITSWTNHSLNAVWLLLLSSCIHHSSSGQRPLQRFTSTSTAVLILPWKRLEWIWQAILLLLINAVSTAPYHSCLDLMALTWKSCSVSTLWAWGKTSARPWGTQFAGKNRWAFQHGICAAFNLHIPVSFSQTTTFPVIKIQFFIRKWHKLASCWRSTHCTQWRSGLEVCYPALQLPSQLWPKENKFFLVYILSTTGICICLAKPPV